MPKLNDRLPQYRLHRQSGQAIVTLSGKDHYLGPHRSEASRLEYDRLIALWLAHGRQVPSPSEVQTATAINKLILAFWEHVQQYYRREDGTQTSEVNNFRQVLRLLRRLYGPTPAEVFGPRDLKALQQEMITLGWCRKSINKQTHRIRHLFKWSASEDRLPAAVYEQLRTVAPLKRGRTAARESPRVRPVPEEYITAIEPFVSRQVWALIRLQLLTGARAGELVLLRGIDLNTQGKIWTAEPEHHKTAYRELAKTIYFGPQAQAILQEFLLGRSLDAYLFSPAEAEIARRAKQHALRKTPPTYGNHPGSNRRSRPLRAPADHYTVGTYRRAIERGCDLAFSLPEHLARHRVRAGHGLRGETPAEWQVRLGPKDWAELKVWRAAHRWHPHQLRHNAATHIKREFGVEVARVILGHRSVPVTEIYAEMDEAKAREAIRQFG